MNLTLEDVKAEKLFCIPQQYMADRMTPVTLNTVSVSAEGHFVTFCGATGLRIYADQKVSQFQ